MARFATLALVAGLLSALLPTSSRAQDGAELVVRMNRLEGQVRQMSGQIEQLQFENRQLKDQVRKFQEDVEFRLQERAGGRSASPAQPSATPPNAAAPARGGRRSDAFDPDAAPAAPGAPRPLGTTAPSGPIIADSGPTQGAGPRPERRRGDDTAFTEGGSAPLDLNAAARGGGGPAGGVSGLNPAAVAGLNPAAAGSASDGLRAEYDAAYALYAQKQYEQAEAALRRFAAAHPRDRLAADAIYWLGESYLQRGKHKEAAEQFLKVSTEHTRSGKAADALLKLGVSLSALGAKDQACATFAELERKYPNATASVKQGVDREQKRARCAG